MGFGSTILGLARKCAAGAADLVLPNVCPGCRRSDVDCQGLCESCNRRLLTMAALPYCPRCGSSLGFNVPENADGCLACPVPLPRFSAVVRIGPYTSPLRDLVHTTKYRGQMPLRGRLARMLAQSLRTRLPESRFDMVIAVPMYWGRRLLRGMDHARVLASALAAELSIPLGYELTRVRNTPPQVHLPRSKRIANVRGAFAARGRATLNGAHVVLVDDVTTTGATANEAARTLLAAGASDVVLVVIAKTEAPQAYADWGLAFSR